MAIDAPVGLPLFAVVQGTANAVGNAVVADCRRVANIVFHLKNIGTATLSAGAWAFEGSVDSTNGTDGTWFPIAAVRTNANTVETTLSNPGTAAGAGYAAAWETSVNGINWFRIRATTAVTANASAQWSVQRSHFGSEPAPATQVPGTQPVSGTVAITTAAGTPYGLTSAASTNAVVIRSAAASLFVLTASNPTATPCYVKLYNKTTAPTVGTDVPVMTIPVPATSFQKIDLGQIGQRFSSGIAMAITAGPLATDTAVAVAGVQILATYV